MIIRSNRGSITLLKITRLTPPRNTIRLIRIISTTNIILNRTIFPSVTLMLQRNMTLRVLCLLFSNIMTLTTNKRVKTNLIITRHRVVISTTCRRLRVKTSLLMIRVKVVGTSIRQNHVSTMVYHGTLRMSPTCLIRRVLHHSLTPRQPQRFRISIVKQTSVVIILLNRRLTINQQSKSTIHRLANNRIVLRTNNLCSDLGVLLHRGFQFTRTNTIKHLTNRTLFMIRQRNNDNQGTLSHNRRTRRRRHARSTRSRRPPRPRRGSFTRRPSEGHVRRALRQYGRQLPSLATKSAPTIKKLLLHQDNLFYTFIPFQRHYSNKVRDYHEIILLHQLKHDHLKPANQLGSVRLPLRELQ